MTGLLVAPPPVPTETTFRLHSWRDLSRAAFLLMESAWLAQLYAAFTRLGGEPVPYGRVLLVAVLSLFLSHGFALALAAWKIRMIFRRVVLGVLVLVSLWIGVQYLTPAETWLSPGALLAGTLGSLLGDALIPARFWSALFILLLWLRGVSLARHELDGQVVLRSFQLGMIAMGLVALFASSEMRFEMLSGLALFTTAGLASLSTIRVHTASLLRAGRQVRFRRFWAFGIAGVILAVLVTGFLLSALFPVTLVQWLSRLVGILLLVLVSGVVFLSALLVDVLIRLLQRFNVSGDTEEFSNRIQQLLNQLPPVQETPLETTPTDPVRLSLTIGVLVLVLVAVVLALRWKPHLEPLVADEQTEDTPHPGGLLDALRARLSGSFDEIRQRLGLASARRMLAAARVRWIYARLMSLSARLGHPRAQAVTPLEFLPALGNVFPGHEADLQRITAAYLRVRYGEVPENSTEVAEVSAAWERVRRVGRKIPSDRT